MTIPVPAARDEKAPTLSGWGFCLVEQLRCQIRLEPNLDDASYGELGEVGL